MAGVKIYEYFMVNSDAFNFSGETPRKLFEKLNYSEKCSYKLGVLGLITKIPVGQS